MIFPASAFPVPPAPGQPPSGTVTTMPEPPTPAGPLVVDVPVELAPTSEPPAPPDPFLNVLEDLSVPQPAAHVAAAKKAKKFAPRARREVFVRWAMFELRVPDVQSKRRSAMLAASAADRSARRGRCRPQLERRMAR